jgi:hypothetical protein
MKTKFFTRNLILGILLLVVQQSAFSQESPAASDFNPFDAPESGKLISVYREFYKQKLYYMAMDTWTVLFDKYPEASEKQYVDGVIMFRQFIEDAPEGQVRENKIDTLMLIYDRRMEYFDGEGNILGRKGNDLLRFRSADLDQAQAAYDMLKESLEMQGTRSRDAVMLNFISAGLILQRAERIDKVQVMDDYFMISGLLDQLEGTSSRWDRARSAIDDMILKEDILTCVGLDLYFGPRFDTHREDRDLLEKMISYYESSGCNQSDFYLAASESLYNMDPDSESAHQLALLFIGREDLEKATFYLQMALFDDKLSGETRADWNYKLSIISLAREEHCEAIEFARESLANLDNYGKAYMVLGDAFIAARKQLGDDFQQRTAYWAAADKYAAAAKMYPSLAEESEEKLASCTAQFPNKEDIFFQDYRLGNSFRVGGCIQENTTIRSRD